MPDREEKVELDPFKSNTNPDSHSGGHRVSEGAYGQEVLANREKKSILNCLLPISLVRSLFLIFVHSRKYVYPVLEKLSIVVNNLGVNFIW